MTNIYVVRMCNRCVVNSYKELYQLMNANQTPQSSNHKISSKEIKVVGGDVLMLLRIILQSTYETYQKQKHRFMNI